MLHPFFQSSGSINIPSSRVLRNERKHRSFLSLPTWASHLWQTRSPAVPLTSLHQRLRVSARSSLNQAPVSVGLSHPSDWCRSNLSLTRSEGPSQRVPGVCLCAHHWIYRNATQAIRTSACGPIPWQAPDSTLIQPHCDASIWTQSSRFLACLVLLPAGVLIGISPEWQSCGGFLQFEWKMVISYRFVLTLNLYY